MKALERTEAALNKSPDRAFGPADVHKQVVISALAVAPDGSSITYVRRTVEDGKYVRRLWRTTFRGGRPEQLTPAKETNNRPRYSPDSRSLLFISDRSGKPQAWVMSLGGGEARQVTDMPDGVGAADWSPDGRRLVLLASCGEKRFIVGKADDPVARRIREYTWKVDGGGYRDEFAAAWIVDVEGGKPRRLTAPTYDVGAAFWSPDGKRIAFLADMRPDADLLELPALWALPSRAGAGDKGPEKLAELAGAIADVAWSDANRIAYLGSSRPKGPGWADMELHVIQDGDSRRLAADDDLNIYNTCYGDYQEGNALWPPPVMWLDESSVLGLVSTRGRSLPYRFGLDGTVEALADGDMVCSYIATGGGRVAAVASTDGPAEVFAVESGAMRQLTTDGSKWFGPFRRRVERVSIPHPDGHAMDAWLLAARGNRDRGPLVITVHGGPHLAYGMTPWLEMTALADAGIHVLWSNPRGSTGYGEAYARAIDGLWGDADASDVLRLAHWAIEERLAEPHRVGIMGLSYGGFMTNWMLGRHPGVFAAAVSENPVTDMIGMYGTSDFGRIIAETAVGVDGLSEHLAEFLERSPYTQIHRNHAPLLLLQAENDLRCPPVNSDLVFAILRSLGRKVEMVRYPDESHLMAAIGRPDRRVDRLERIVGWFEEHLAPNK